jgi:prevent-host-death family protein
MLSSVGAYQAKTHLAELLDRVERGERITITRHGRPVAVLVPPAGIPDVTVDEAIDALRSFRSTHSLGPGVTIRDLIEEGRR